MWGEDSGPTTQQPKAFMALLALTLMLAGQATAYEMEQHAPYSPFKFQLGAAPGLDTWFKDAKLGMFMHWGPVSQWGTEISFPLLCNGLPCSPKGPNNSQTNITTLAELAAHRQAYADLAKTFDPVEFDAANMAKLAKAAGFKYLIYTTVWNPATYTFGNYTTKLPRCRPPPPSPSPAVALRPSEKHLHIERTERALKLLE